MCSDDDVVRRDLRTEKRSMTKAVHFLGVLCRLRTGPACTGRVRGLAGAGEGPRARSALCFSRAFPVYKAVVPFCMFKMKEDMLERQLRLGDYKTGTTTIALSHPLTTDRRVVSFIDTLAPAPAPLFSCRMHATISTPTCALPLARGRPRVSS